MSGKRFWPDSTFPVCALVINLINSERLIIQELCPQLRLPGSRFTCHLPMEHLDLLNVSTLGIDALKCLTHYFLVSTDHLVHRHELFTVHEKGDVPVAWFKQRFNRCYTFRQTAPRVLYDSSPRRPRQDHRNGCTAVVDFRQL